jgi:hypothetical protein
MFTAGAALALLDAHLRCDPPAAGALRSRLALQSAAASAKLLRLNTDEGALRDLRFVAGEGLAPAATLLALEHDLAGRPPSLDPDRLRAAVAALDLALPDSNALASRLKTCAGEGDPAPAAVKAAAVAFFAVPDAPAPRPNSSPSECSTRRSPSGSAGGGRCRSSPLRFGGGARPRPSDPAWPNAAAGAIALAAAAALDLATGLDRRAKTLIAVAPKLRAKPAAKIIDLLLAQNCVAPAEAAHHAPMTDRTARRLFDRLVALGAAREFSGRPTFRLYGL